MRSISLGTAILVTVLLSAHACSDRGQQTRVINPNGDSELALLMRAMHEDGLRVRQQILNGETPKIRCDYQGIFGADATEPEKVASTEYALYGKAYTASVEMLLNAQVAERPVAYQNMINACMQCHKEMCPGPIVKIEKMYLAKQTMEK